MPHKPKTRARHKPPPPLETPRSLHWATEVGIVCLFCCAFAFLVIRFASTSSAAYDETTHLTSGYTYWKWNDYRMNPEHPPLVKRLAALPLLAMTVLPGTMDLQAGDETESRGTTTERSLRRFWALGIQSIDQQWNFAQGFLYGPTVETQQRFGVADPHDLPTTAALEKTAFLNDAQTMLFWGRMPILLLGCALLPLTYVWARRLFGVAGGVLALALICFDPNVIAHSGLVTMDIGVTLLMFSATWFLWRAFERLEWWSAALFMVAFGLAFAAKFSAVLLGPLFWLLAIGRIVPASAWPVGRSVSQLATRIEKLAALAALFVGACLTALFVIWAVYGFRFSAARDPLRAATDEAAVLGYQVGNLPFHTPGQLPIELAVRRTAVTETRLANDAGTAADVATREELERTPIGIGGSMLLWAYRMKLVPEAYLYGLAVVRQRSLTRSAYLRGETSVTGFRSYFFWTVVLKTPIPALLLILAGAFLAVRRGTPGPSSLAFLVVPIVGYLVVSVSTNLNIGHRHLLPIYPFLYVLSGAVTAEWAAWRATVRRWTATATLLVLPASCAFVFAPLWKPQQVHPHYLAYFNEFAGGPIDGYQSLADSNVDWGQDLVGLKTWLDKVRPADPIVLCYFGMGDARFYGISHLNPPKALGGYLFEPSLTADEFLNSLTPGRYVAISATHRAGVYLEPNARDLWQQLIAQSTYVDQIGYSIYIYRVNSPK